MGATREPGALFAPFPPPGSADYCGVKLPSSPGKMTTANPEVSISSAVRCYGFQAAQTRAHKTQLEAVCDFSRLQFPRKSTFRDLLFRRPMRFQGNHTNRCAAIHSFFAYAALQERAT